MHENGRWCETLDTYSISIALIVEWMEAITALGLHKLIANNVLLSTYESNTTETELLI